MFEDDIRAYARLQLGISGMTRDRHVAAVRAYAIEKHGDKQDVKMMAERTARYLWAARPKNG